MEEIKTIVYEQTFEDGKEVMTVVDVITETIENPKVELIDKAEALNRLELLTKEIELIKENAPSVRLKELEEEIKSIKEAITSVKEISQPS